MRGTKANFGNRLMQALKLLKESNTVNILKLNQ